METKTIKQESSKKMLITFVLDASSSMYGNSIEGIPLYQEAVHSFNKTIKNLKKEKGVDYFITLILFGKDISIFYENKPLIEILYKDNYVKSLSEDNYFNYADPTSTSLYDAIGLAYYKMKKSIKNTGIKRNLITVFTDGEENSSKEYNSKMIKDIMKESIKKSIGLIFQSASPIFDRDKNDLGISKGNSLNVSTMIEFHENSNRVIRNICSCDLTPTGLPQCDFSNLL